jgi:phenylalanyl-tRNA synthetase alpha subunit
VKKSKSKPLTEIDRLKLTIFLKNWKLDLFRQTIDEQKAQIERQSARYIELEKASNENIASFDEKITHLQEENDRLKLELGLYINSAAHWSSQHSQAVAIAEESRKNSQGKIEALSTVIAELQRTLSEIQREKINAKALEASEQEYANLKKSCLEQVEKAGVKL